MKRRRVPVLLAALGLAVVLSGCASGSLLDNQVQTYSHLTAVPAQPSYRFERLPSQQAMDPAQSSIEQMADAALHKAGLRRDDSAPRYSVQVAARAQHVASPYVSPGDGWGFGWGLGMQHRGLGIGLGGPLFARPEPAWIRREVSVIVRELASNRVVYETHASNDGPWLDHRAVYPLMFEAAMQGFPNPPPGPRRVDIPIGGRG